MKTALGVAALFTAAWVTLRMLLPTTAAEGIGMVAVENAVLPVLLPVLAAVTVWESLVLVSAVLDWREARLAVVGWRQAWAVAHATVLVRAYRRAVWVSAGARIAAARAQERRHMRQIARHATNEYVVLDPAEPFNGVVVDADKDAA